MRIDLSGKTAIITGSTAGIGLATAKGLAAAGAKVVVNGRTEEAVERAVKAVGTAAPSTHYQWSASRPDMGRQRFAH
jgi:NAD(P)-dependent dehydrogenase (short-subunit alcohol dehydrogenase family)